MFPFKAVGLRIHLPVVLTNGRRRTLHNGYNKSAARYVVVDEFEATIGADSVTRVEGRQACVLIRFPQVLRKSQA